MSLFRFLRQSVFPILVRRGPLRLTAACAALLAAGTFSSALLAAPQDTCLPVLGCVTTSVPTVTLPTVTVPTLPTSTNTTPTTTTTGSSGTAGGTTISTPTTPTTADQGASTPGPGLSVRISVRVRGHGAKRAIELRLRLNKPARVSSLLSRGSKTLVRRQFAARAGASVWRLRLARTVKPGAAKLGLTYRATTGETARSTHRLRLPS